MAKQTVLLFSLKMIVMLLALCLPLPLTYQEMVKKFIKKFVNNIIILFLTELDPTKTSADEESCSYITEEECDPCDDTENVPSVPSTPSDKTDELKPALRFSTFSGIPPYLNFCLHDEKGIP